MDVQAVRDWLDQNEALLWWLGAASVVTFLATLVIVPRLIVRLPADYFAHNRRRPPQWFERYGVLRVAVLVVKNVAGCLFILAGIPMLFLPGQGLLTMFVGLLLLNFPGKYRLERWLVTRSAVLRSMNWLRRRAGRPPLVFDAVSDTAAEHRI